MAFKFKITYTALVILLCSISVSSLAFATEETKETNSILGLSIDKSNKTLNVTIDAQSPITAFTTHKIKGGEGKNARMYIDIQNIAIENLPKSKTIQNSSVTEIRTAPRENGARIVFNSATEEIFKFDVASSIDGLQITIQPTNANTGIDDTTVNNSKVMETSGSDSALDKLITSSEKLLAADNNVVSTLDEQDGTPTNESIKKAFSGYDKEKVSVDFYKIDLHNVFRLLREISGQNIIVDESVNGSLTLAMTDVPWDFILDVVLNLKGLDKEEKFNTIVIYPKGKGFEWPENTGGKLSIEPIESIIASDELIIEQTAQIPEETLLAKELIAQARKDEKRGNIELAIDKYSQAFKLWPENNQIATRISTLYLVDLGLNAKALYYAKKALAVNASDDKAALYAAISAANMGKKQEASEFFTQSVSVRNPSKEAIVSFAAFAENNGNNEGALSLLNRLHELFGESVNSMVAIARIYDQEGEIQMANKQYETILASGFQINPDLRSYINERLDSNINQF